MGKDDFLKNIQKPKDVVKKDEAHGGFTKEDRGNKRLSIPFGHTGDSTTSQDKPKDGGKK